MANTLQLCLIFAVVASHGLHAARILSMRINTKGYTLGILDKTDKMGLSFKINTYAKGNDCIKVVNIEQLSPERNVDKIQVSCDPPNWSVTKAMVHYGDVIHMQTSRKKVVWAVFDLGDKCIQKTYRDKEVAQLGKLVLNLNREECDQVVATQKPKRKTKDTAASAGSQPTQTSVQPVPETMATGNKGSPNSLFDFSGDALVTGTTTNDNANDGVTTTTTDFNNDGVTSIPTVISLDEAGTEMTGYFTNDPSITVNSGPLMLVIGTYYKGTECFKQISMYFHSDMVDQLKVTCDLASGWGDNGYYQHGRAFFVLPEANNNFRALFRFKDNKCIKKTYIFSTHDPTELTKTTKHTAINQECVDLGNGKDFVSGQVSSGVEGVSNPLTDAVADGLCTGSSCAISSVPGDDFVSDTTMDGNFNDEVAATTINNYNDGVASTAAVVVSTSPVIQPPPKQTSKKPSTTAVTKPGTSGTKTPMTEEYRLINKQKVVVPNGNVNGYVKQGSPKTVQGRGFTFIFQNYVKSGTGECVKLVSVKKNSEGIVDHVKISCEFEEPDKLRGFNLNIGNVIFEDPPFDVKYVVKDGVCLNREYFRKEKGDKKLSGLDCDKLTGRTKEERINGVIRGTEPMSPADLAALENQIVAVLDGSIKDYKPQGSKTIINTKTYVVEVQNYMKDGQCVKVVSYKRRDHDQYFDRVKMSCRVKGPVITKNPDYELIYGNLIYIEDRYDSIFVLRNGVCLKRGYYVFWNDVEKTDKILNENDCDRKTRWSLKMRKSPSKLNRELPPKQSSGDYSHMDDDVQDTEDIPDTLPGTVISVPDATDDFDQSGAGEVNAGVDDLDLAVHEAFDSDYTAEQQIDLTGGGQQPEATSTQIAPSTKEYDLLNKQKVVVLNANLKGFQRQGPPNTVKGRGFDFTVERYVKPGTGDCVKLVTITKEGDVKDKVKMSCEYVEPDKLRGFDLHISSIIFEDPQFDVKYVIEGGVCVKREYFRGDITEKKLSEEACYKLTQRTKAQRISGIIPGTEPITPEDLYAMDNEIVAVLDGSVKDFEAKGPRTTFSTRTGLYQVEVQHYVKGNQCIKLVSFKRNDHDQYFDQVKLSCKIKAPVVINDEDIELNYGNVIYIEDRFDAVFIMKGGECLKRDYFVFRNDVEKTDKIMSLVNCFVYTRWKLAQRKSPVRLNKPPPPKTNQAPGFGWILALNGDTNGYTPGSIQNNMNSNPWSYYTQDFTKEDEECVRLVVFKMYNKVVDTFKVSCGPSKGMTMINTYIRYGKAFTFQPDKGNNKYKALFNLRDGSCIPRTYTVEVGSPVKMIQGAKVQNDECNDLREGKGNMGGISINGGNINFGNNNIYFGNNVNKGKKSGGLFGGLFSSWGK